MRRMGVDYRLVKTWTTDAIYRETWNGQGCEKLRGVALWKWKHLRSWLSQSLEGWNLDNCFTEAIPSRRMDGMTVTGINAAMFAISLFWMAAETLIDL